MRESKAAQGNSLNVQTQFIPKRKLPIFSLAALVLGKFYEAMVLNIWGAVARVGQKQASRASSMDACSLNLCCELLMELNKPSLD